MQSLLEHYTNSSSSSIKCLTSTLPASWRRNKQMLSAILLHRFESNLAKNLLATSSLTLDTAGSNQKERDHRFNAGCLFFFLQLQYLRKNQQMESFQTVTFSRYKKHHIKGQNNSSTKTGGVKNSRHNNRDVEGQKKQQLKELYIKEQPNYFEQLNC